MSKTFQLTDQRQFLINCFHGFAIKVTPIPETSPMVERSNAVSAMCQQLSQGLSLLSSTDDPFLVDNKVNVTFYFSFVLD